MSLEWLLFLSAITTIIIPGAYAGLQEMSISDRSSVSERTMKSILELCYVGDSSSDAIVVVGDFNEFTDKLPMIRIDSKNLGHYPFLNLKLTKVIIVIDFIEELVTYIQLLKHVRFWNHMASFFIISKFSCLEFISLFGLITSPNMINSIYICPESKNTSVLYTVNTYDNYAPHPWKIAGEVLQFALFSQQFDKNVSCSSLNYDKTKKLNRHAIRMLISKPAGTYFVSEMDYWPWLHDEKGFPMKLMHDIIRALNTEAVLNIRTGIDATIEIIQGGVADIMLDVCAMEEYPTMKNLFPEFHDRIVAVIKSSSEKSTQNKILHLWSGPVIFLAFTALVILFFILFWKNRDFSSTLLDVIRLIIYSSILTSINSHSFRIFFTPILIMMIISNGVFQGKIAAFLTTHERKEPIERIETLVQLGYDLYSDSIFGSIIRVHYPQYKIKIVDLEDCFRHVLKDGHAACLIGETIYQQFASKPFDLVTEPVHQTFLVMKCRDDWPLYDRMNDMWMRVFESGLHSFLVKNYTDRPLRERQIEDFLRSSDQYQPIELYKLLFAFHLLAIGLSFCTIVFIGELLVKKYGNRT